jgi:hypothetical protein
MAEGNGSPCGERFVNRPLPRQDPENKEVGQPPRGSLGFPLLGDVSLALENDKLCRPDLDNRMWPVQGLGDDLLDFHESDNLNIVSLGYLLYLIKSQCCSY